MPMTDELFKLLDESSDENRTAFIAALIMDRCKHAPDHALIRVPSYTPHHAERIARTLVRLAGVIKRYAEKACSEELTERDEKAIANNSAKFEAIAALIGFEAHTGGDPRGPCAYLVDPANPKDGDGWGHGFAVYR